MRLSLVLILTWINCATVTVYGETREIKPRGVLFPWEMPGMSHDFRSQHRDELHQSWDMLKNLYLPLPKSLHQFGRDNARDFTLNQQRKSEMIAVSVRHNLASINESIYLQPVLCPLQDRMLLIFLVGRFDNGELLQILSEPILANPRSPSVKIPGDAFQAASQRLWERLSTTPPARYEPANHYFKLGLGLLKGGPDQVAGSFLCPTLLAAEALLPITPIHLNIGSEHLVHIRDILGATSKLLRANHMLSLDWPSNIYPGRAFIPSPFVVGSQFSEAVFAKTIQTRRDYQFNWTPDQQLRPDPKLLRLIQDQQRKLRVDEWPMVVGTYGAWAYVDRGRAWGLEMGDRLWIERDGQTIKGHVVKFYGPELKLNSPRGFPISEGAIVFIRTGQRKVKEGDIFRFDPTEFPTPWPPESTPLPDQTTE